MLADPTVISKGLTPGLELEILQGSPDTECIRKVDTGTLTQVMMAMYDRLARSRQEATRTNDLQLGRQAIRKTSATEINQIQESSDDLFSNMALRFEDTAIEPLLELCWLFLWQFADPPMIQRIGTVMDPQQAQSLAVLSPEERFVAFANSVSFKVQGYKYQLASTKQIQTIVSAMQMAAQNPALGQVVQQDVSMRKFFKMLLRSQGIDPDGLKPDPGELGMNPMLLQGQAGNPQAPGGQNPAQAPDVGQAQGTMAPPNAMGQRGIQQP